MVPEATRPLVPETVIRPLVTEDLPACAEVFHTSLGAFLRSRGEPIWPRNDASMLELYGRLVASHPAGAWVAERSRSIVAFVIAIERDRCWFLSFLFVLPADQSAGLGRRLLERALPKSGVEQWLAGGGWLSTVIDASQPVSTALYASFGMVPRTPLYLLTGEVVATALPPLPTNVEAIDLEELERTDDGELAAILARFDRDAVGFERPDDHRDDRAGGRIGVLFRTRDAGRALGYGYVQPSGRIGPVYAEDPALLPAIVGSLMGRVRPVGGWQVVAAGAAAAFPVLLRAGFRIDGAAAIHCGTATARLASDRYLPRNFALL